VNGGGFVVANGDNTIFSSQIDPLLNAFGLDTVSPNQDSAVALTILQPNHPVMRGPFGQVTDLQAGDAAALAPPLLGAVILAQSPDGRGSIAAADPAPGRLGALVFFPDSENNLTDFGSRGPSSPDESRLAFLNTVAYAATFARSDATPPTVTCAVTRPLLWPANLGLVPVGLSFTAADAEDPVLDVIVEVWSDEPDNTPPGLVPDGLDAGGLRLRAERLLPGDGRVYLAIVRARDNCANQGVTCCTVVVPASATVGGILSAYAQAANARATCSATGLPPAGWLPIVTYVAAP
jgi:hypothetical protein